MSVIPGDSVWLVWRDLGANGRVLVRVVAGKHWAEAYVRDFGDVKNLLYCEEWGVI